MEDWIKTDEEFTQGSRMQAYGMRLQEVAQGE
jgi:hypothetical protein